MAVTLHVTLDIHAAESQKFVEKIEEAVPVAVAGRAPHMR
jgi:hypothetical protein